MGSGAHAGVYPRDPRFRREIISRLRQVAGLEVWERHEIPEELHYKTSKNSPPILVLARPQNIILSRYIIFSITVITVTNLVLLSPPEVQRPAQGQCREGGRAHGRRQSHFRGVMRLMEQTRMGLAGYDPAEEDMRGVFMAKGPGERQQLQCHYSEALLDLFKQVITNFGVLAYFHN